MRSERKSFVIEVSVGNLLVAHGYNLSRDKQARSWPVAAFMRLAARQAKHCVFVCLCTAEDPRAPPLAMSLAGSVLGVGCQRFGRCMPGGPSHVPPLVWYHTRGC